MSLPFLPSQYYSKLNHIFLLALFHAGDRTSFGNRLVFQKVADKLNTLLHDGVFVTTNAYSGIVKFRVACLTGDNLGLNSILGFVESFNASHCCRICNVNKQQLQTLFFEDRTLLRSPEEYEQQVLQNDVSITGIKEKCVLLDALDGFKLFDHVAVDVLHDYLEGCCRYVMTFVVNFLVNDSKIVPLNLLQAKLTAFDYGPDSSSNPSNCIVLDGRNIKLKTSAAEMLTLVRYFGLMVGLYVPEDCNVWSLYINLRKILDRLLNSTVTMHGAEQLKFLISELNQCYCELTKSQLQPKFHFLTHYPDMLLKFSPLTQIWTMRFEARHRILKEAARASSSKVNICKTVAVKNQLLLNDLFLRNEPLNDINMGKKQNSSPLLINIVKNKFGNNYDTLFSVQWLSIMGTKVHVSSIVTVDLNVDTFLPLFGDVGDILVSSDNEVFFFCNLYNTVYYDTHYFAYKVVHDTKEKIVLRAQDLHSLVPNTLTIMQDLGMYITVRRPID